VSANYGAAAPSHVLARRMVINAIKAVRSGNVLNLRRFISL
jgi:hypothetical protein